MEKEEIYKEAINHWGKELQIGMLMEEVGELFVAVNKFRRGRLSNKNRIAEEIADVMIMLEEISFMFEIDEDCIAKWKVSKLKRLEIMLKASHYE